MGKGLRTKNMAIRYVGLDSDEVWNGSMGKEREKREVEEIHEEVYEVDYGSGLEDIRLYGERGDGKIDDEGKSREKGLGVWKVEIRGSMRAEERRNAGKR